jgi:hypothetical protein
MQIKSLDEFNILQMLHSEISRLRKADRLIDKVIITEDEYERIRETLGISGDQHIPTIPPSGTLFYIRREDGTEYNPVEEAQNRKVQVASASDEIFKQ